MNFIYKVNKEKKCIYFEQPSCKLASSTPRAGLLDFYRNRKCFKAGKDKFNELPKFDPDSKGFWSYKTFDSLQEHVLQLIRY